MLIYLKGIASVHLKHLLGFIYNGEASVEKEELKEFLEMGKELQVKGFEAYVEVYENTDDITGENGVCDTFEAGGTLNDTDSGDVKSDLDLQIMEMIEKSDGVCKCKVCGKTEKYCSLLKEHAESHIEGISHTCHICNKTYPNRPGLRSHIRNIHSELLSCDLCGKSGMNKKDYYNHKLTKRHKTLSGTL